MAKSLSSSPFNKILILVFGIAFGLVALAMVYQGTKTSTDIRSRAAKEEKIVQGWEFNGETTEDWTGVNINSLNLKPIVLPNKALVFGVLGIGKPGEIRNDTVKTIPVGFKEIKFRLLASSMTKKSYPFTMKIVLSNKTKGDVFTKSMSGIADNEYHEYEVTLPQTLPVKADSMKIIFSGFSISDNYVNIGIDWIHIVLTNPSVPTPTPPSGCYYQNVQCIKAPCPPILVCPTPTPPPGCYYQQVQCIKEPCKPILVCPTPTPTPTPKPIP